MFEKLLIVYYVGFVAYAAKSIHFVRLMKKSERTTAKKVLSESMTKYLCCKTILWPWFFVVEKGPLERLSDLFFKYYGADKTINLGTQGLRNFCNDVFRGKNRYQGWRVKSLVWPLEKPVEIFPDGSKSNSCKMRHALITLATNKERYLYMAVLSNETIPIRVNRYWLDDCKKLSKAEVIDELRQLNPTKALEFFSEDSQGQK
jgi:hypothetical protein